MAFHNVTLPPDFRYGSSSGAGFATIFQETASGHEVRIARQSQARHRFSLLKEIQSLQEATAIKNFAMGRRGGYHSWRLRDWLDYSTHESGTGAPSPQDELLGTCTAATDQSFQLLKEYDKTGPEPYVRRLRLPVLGSVRVALDGVETFSFSVSSTGSVTILGSGHAGKVVQAGCLFDCEVRFERSFDEWARFSPMEFNSWKIEDMGAVEVLDEELWPEAWWSGGCRDYGSINVDQSAAFADGQLHVLTATASLNLFLPPPGRCPGGDRILTVHNRVTSTGDVQLRDHLGGAVGSAMIPGTTRRLMLLVTGNTATWIG